MKSYQELVESKLSAGLSLADAQKVAKDQIKSDVEVGLRDPAEWLALSGRVVDTARDLKLDLADQKRAHEITSAQLDSARATIADLESKLTEANNSLAQSLTAAKNEEARADTAESSLKAANAKIAELSNPKK